MFAIFTRERTCERQSVSTPLRTANIANIGLRQKVFLESWEKTGELGH